MSKEQLLNLIKDLDIRSKLIDYHYNVCREYKVTDDIESDEAMEYVVEILEENDIEDSTEVAKKIMELIGDELIAEIYERDEDADETYRELEEARRGRY